MNILQYFNGQLLFALLAFFLVIVYVVNRFRNNRKFKR
jgi:flagellar biogenesis protein FliO